MQNLEEALILILLWCSKPSSFYFGFCEYVRRLFDYSYSRSCSCHLATAPRGTPTPRPKATVAATTITTNPFSSSAVVVLVVTCSQQHSLPMEFQTHPLATTTHHYYPVPLQGAKINKSYCPYCAITFQVMYGICIYIYIFIYLCTAHI